VVGILIINSELRATASTTTSVGMLDTMSKEKETQGKSEQTFLWLSGETSVLPPLFEEY
jgi:hypothetical protein